MGNNISKIGVIGAGSWGTALANLLAQKGMDVALWVREEEVYEQIVRERVNGSFLSGVSLSSHLTPAQTFEEALSGKELALIVVPSHVFRKVLEGLRAHLREGMHVMAATKGIENETGMTMSQVAESIVSESFMKTYGCLSGPSFAQEVAAGYPTAVTIACNDMEHAENLQRLFTTSTFRVYVSQDLTGLQL